MLVTQTTTPLGAISFSATSLMREGYQALMRNGQVVHFGPVGQPIEDVEFDHMILHPADVAKLKAACDAG